MPTAEGYFTVRDGSRLYFQRQGSGPDLIVLPNGTYLLEDFEALADGRELLAYDLRHRGRSESSGVGGIQQDVDDLEDVRRHFGIGRLNLIGHSYVGLTAVLYAMRHPDRVHRVVQIGPIQPNQATRYPEHLTGADDIQRDVFARLGELQKERGAHDPVEFCRKFWSVLALLYVTDPADAGRITWGRCDLPNERAAGKYWIETVLPSIQEFDPSAEASKAEAPVLTIHGARDRSAPYAGGRDWALLLPNARLVTIAGGGHAPWIEAPEQVFGAIREFFGGSWPAAAESVVALEPSPAGGC